MKFKCFAFGEVVSDKDKITPVCKILDHDSTGQMICATKECKFYKTWDEFNSRKVEGDVKRYGEKRGQE